MTDIDNHHAYFVEGSRAEGLKFVLATIKNKFKIKIEKNPDIQIFEFEGLGIKEAREVKETASLAPIYSQKKIIIVSFDSITREAANALLKVLEEPPESLMFFLISDSVNCLIPTLRSRLSIISLPAQIQDKKNGTDFFSFPLRRKIEIVNNLIEDIKKEKKIKKDAENFLISIAKNLNSTKSKDILSLEIPLRYINNPSASSKMLLEYLSLKSSL